jgi:hypothetical protein
MNMGMGTGRDTDTNVKNVIDNRQNRLETAQYLIFCVIQYIEDDMLPSSQIFNTYSLLESSVCNAYMKEIISENDKLLSNMSPSWSNALYRLFFLYSMWRCYHLFPRKKKKNVSGLSVLQDLEALPEYKLPDGKQFCMP